MTPTAVLVALLALIVGVVVGWFVARSKSSSEQSATTQRAISDAQLDASNARNEAGRAREEAAEFRTRVAQHEAEVARLNTAIATIQSQVSDARAQTAEARSLIAQANTATAEALAEVARLEAERDSVAERAKRLAEDHETLANRFKVLSEESLERQSAKAEKTAAERMAATQQLVAPLADGLKQLQERLTEVELERTKLTAELSEQVRAVRDSGEVIRREANSLGQALRTPQVRGSWGEQSLRRMVEISGLTNRCDFDDQQSYTVDGGDRFRPDMRINLADGKVIFVDSKVPLSAVLDAYNTEDEGLQAGHLDRFAKHVRKHIDDLSGKSYWQLELGSPEFVVLYLGSDEFYRLAQEKMPDLHDYAARRQIMLASPGTLIPMLHIVSHGWKQASVAESAAQVAKLGRELYERIATMGDHFDKLGRSISSTVTNFNKAVGTLETRVMVSARRFRDYEIADKELPELTGVDVDTRQVAVPEMLTHRENAAIEATLLDEAQLDTDHAVVRQLPFRASGTDS